MIMYRADSNGFTIEPVHVYKRTNLMVFYINQHGKMQQSYIHTGSVVFFVDWNKAHEHLIATIKTVIATTELELAKCKERLPKIIAMEAPV